MSKRSTLILVGALAIGVVLVLRFSGKSANAEKSEASLRPVAVALARESPISDMITLSGEFRPFQEVDVHAKVAGYIRKIYVDVGDHVKTGQTLAILEVPELDAQLQGAEAAIRRSQDAIRRAQGDLKRAESLHQATHLDYTRLKQASEARPGLIAEQELDNAQAKDREGEAQISADEAAFSEARNQLDVASAEQKQLSAMSGYAQIVAPFDGVITKRYVDTGALVQAGTSSNTQAVPVVSVAQTDLFRLTLAVPESAVPMIRLGTTVTVHVQALNRDFEGKVARFANAVNQETRTMHTEVDVRNPSRSIVEGMYAVVKLTLAKSDHALAVPIQAVSREGSHTTVLVVNSNDQIEEREVHLGIEGANQVEVVAGLKPNDRVVMGSRSDFRPGERVDPKVIADNNEAQY
ncbi:MAG TPA: efflux RND transporter periplasmic adaptor subunit [Terriglobales bacterium]|jgi:RND family efflux transporter MFP subunit|nr:efflux RND transporter periplasmic adaptor subunit [Terriglobales bacterium]